MGGIHFALVTDEILLKKQTVADRTRLPFSMPDGSCMLRGEVAQQPVEITAVHSAFHIKGYMSVSEIWRQLDRLQHVKESQVDTPL